ncbi:MAG: AAA family ATPase [Gammaproteobacteria bacterium]
MDNLNINALLKTYASKQLNKGYKLIGTHLYEDINGDLIYLRMRLKHPSGEKWIRPFHLDKNNLWVMKEPSFLRGKPLYKLPLLAKLSDETVYITEGETKVDALIALGFYATTSGSSNSATDANWDILKNTNVIIWPDKDKAGCKYAREVTEILSQLNCNVQWIDTDELNLPEGGDIIDWLQKNSAVNKNDIQNLKLISPLIQSQHNINYRIAADITIKPIDWLWEKRFAKGKISFISGDAGVGKSQLTANMAATITQGNDWPDQTKCNPGKVIFLSAEDNAEDTLVPRLMAAGADLKKIVIIDSVKRLIKNENSIEDLFDINADIPELANLLGSIQGVSAIFIDPITAYVGDIDDSKNTQVRATLAPLSKLAELHNISIICISHNNKSKNQSAIHRVAGSIAYVAASRAAYVVVKGKRNSPIRLFLPLKNNIGNDQTGLSYSIEECQVENGIISSRINWESSCVAISAEDALSDNNENEKDAVDEAKDFLAEILADSEQNAVDVYAEAEKVSISAASIKRARKELGIKSRKVKGIKNGNWCWSLPKKESTEEIC